MTAVEIVEGKKNVTKHWMIKAEGHAGFAPNGQDIVCAAVSALLGALRLTLKEWEAGGEIIDYECMVYDGNLTIVFWSKTDKVDVLMEYIETGIRAIAEDHPAHVSFHRHLKEF